MSDSQGFPFRSPFHLWTALTPDEVQLRLEDRATQVTAEGFVVGPRPPAVWLPRMRGRYQAASGGTYLVIEPVVQAPMLLVLLLLMVFVGPLALVVLAVMASSRYRSDTQALEALRARLRVVEEGTRAVARLRDQPVSDPTSEGAVSGAPASFSVRTAFDGATFQLHGSGGERRRLEVSQQGVRLHRATGPVRLDWVDLDQVDLQQGLLLLKGTRETLFVDVAGHPEDDRIWMALYLQACQQRWAPAREEHERERARLAELAARTKRPT